MMIDKLISALETLGYPVIQQGTLEPERGYPDTLITFLTIDSFSAADFDNDNAVIAYAVTVNHYSTDPLTVDKLKLDIRNALKGAGFISIGRGRDLISNENNYTAWTCDYYFLKREGVNNA